MDKTTPAATCLVLTLFAGPDNMQFNKKLYRELRCNHCRKLICYEYIFAGRVYFKCPRCNEDNVFEFKHLKTQDNDNILREFEVNKLKKSKGGEK